MSDPCLAAAESSATTTEMMPLREENKSLLTISDLSGDSEEHLLQIITNFAQTLSYGKMSFLGYPSNLEFDYEALAPLQHYHINNAGDPFAGSRCTLNSLAFEVCVLDWFASLWEIPKNQYWGYVTTGGTEGNLHGILVGREHLPDGILYASEESHYSVFKVARICRIQCVKVGTLRSGGIDCSDLKASLLTHSDAPAIINLNIGTTMKGAIDDVDLVVQTLQECGFSRDRFYIHCDAALSGLMLPFIKQAPRLSFKKPIGSIAISGHKFIGSPVPCGVIITRLEYMKEMSSDTEYIASMDTTITGSRNGHAPIFLWYALKKKGSLGLKNEVDMCIRNADYLKNKLREAGISTMKNDFSNTVVFERPEDNEFARRWSLACKGNMAHIVVMQHVTVEILDSFVTEFLQKRSFKHQKNGNNNNQLSL